MCKPCLRNRLPSWMLVVLANHGGQEGRLRAGEVIGSIRVKDGAVVLDLEEEVLDHIAGKVVSLVSDETEKNEVAVPTVHLVEATTGHDVGVGKIEKTRFGNVFDCHVAQVNDLSGEVTHLNLTFALHCCDR